MRRVFVILVVLSAVTAGAFASAGAGGDDDNARKFTLELDNAFGLVEGGDMKVAGVRAGRITKLRLDRKTKHALVDFEITRTGFGSLRSDVFCESRPQSLIGEYFIDCRPGTAPKELEGGALIPIEQSATTIPIDVVNNIMRRPYRERFSIILRQLGAGVGARGEDLNEAIRRASPALRETERVLAILGRQNTVLQDLVTDADKVIGDLTGNRKDVVRWVKETRQTSAASAERREQIAESLRRLPGFLRQLGPTMTELGRTADAQTPTLVDLNRSADQLENLFTSLEPFSRSTQANLRAVGKAAEQGRPAVKAARPLVAELDRFSKNTPETASNLRIILKDLDDRDRATEPDPRSPGGKGYTGFESLLQFIFNQAAAINIFDANGYILKVNAFEGECADYQNAESLKEHMAEDPDFYKRCASILGPSQQGVLQPDPTAGLNKPSQRKRKSSRSKRPERSEERPGAEDTPQADKPADKPKPELPQVKPPIDLNQTLEDLLEGKVPDLRPSPEPQLPNLGGLLKQGADQQALLDYLLGP